MEWNLEEALQYYRRQGAPSDQTALVNLLKEIQQQHGSGVPLYEVAAVAQAYGIKQSFLLAIIKRLPSLRLENTHLLEICCGENCPRRAPLAAFVRRTYGANPAKFTVKAVGCMRMCGKGPNIKWDGTLYHAADEALIRRLVESIP